MAVVDGPYRYDARYKLREMAVTTFADGDDTPSVANMDNHIFKTNNSGAIAIAAFDDLEIGRIVIIIGDSNTKFQHGAGIKLNQGASGNYVTYSANDVIEFVSDGSIAYQAGQSFNS